ncbi:MAG: iron-sulfur cluster assembly scaffold protein [Thermoplasmata archaeon]|nr:iron-sulfur cluster assembly scaffold protein [Thermoplasmata archaeon]
MSAGDDTDFDKMIQDIQEEIDRDAEATFSKKAIEEYKNPQNVGRMSRADSSAKITGICGDTVEIYIKVEGDRIIDIQFMTDGCGATIACGSMGTKMAKGKTLAEIKKMNDDDLINALDGLPEENLHCARLMIATLHRAINKYEEQQG